MEKRKIKKIMRCRTHKCGKKYMESDIYGYFAGMDLSQPQKEANDTAERKESSLKQKSINAKNANRKCRQLVAANFTEKAIHLAATYSDTSLPETEAQALKDRTNYLRRIKRECEKQMIPPPKYIAVTEYQTENKETHTKAVRFHHHIILECGLSRDTIENLWSTGRGKKKQKIGRVNADRLQFEHGNCEALVEYMMKYPNRRHRWTASIGLKQPKHSAPDDERFGNRQIERMCENGQVYCAEYWERKYKGWKFAQAKPVFNEFTGWAVYLKFYK